MRTHGDQQRTWTRAAFAGPEHADARWIAERAGQVLLSLGQEVRPGDRQAKTVATTGDLVATAFVLRTLAERYPDDAILSMDSPIQLEGPLNTRLWIVNPLEASESFAEAGRTDWSVHIALAIDGDPVAGAVSLPARGLTFSSELPAPLSPPTSTSVRLAVSRTHPPAGIDELAEYLEAEVAPMGTFGEITAALLRGEVDLFIHGDRHYAWESAAAVAVARAAGLHASRIDGEEPHYSPANPMMPDLLICRPSLVDLAIDGIARCL
jgi:3'(2'), 5'-bisphosphate nucleotidase